MSSRDDLQRLAKAGAHFTLCAVRGKRPVDKEWQRTPKSLGAALAHLDTGGNVGILPGEFSAGLIALDLDKGAGRFAKEYPHLCVWRVKRENAPSRGKVIIRCVGAHNRKEHAAGLEVLANGSNAIVAGMHETGFPVIMELATPEPPELTVEELGVIFEAWTGVPYLKAARASSTFVPSAAALSSTPARQGVVYAVRMVLQHVPAYYADSYTDWVRVGVSLKHELGDAGLPLWEEWSRQSTKFEEGACERKWSTFPVDGGVTIKTLRWMAQAGALHGLR